MPEHFTPGTLVWVRCEDGLWWPAKVADVPEADVRQVEAEKDMCVEFFHHTGEYYTVNSSDSTSIRTLHIIESQRTMEEKRWFQCPQVFSALQILFQQRCQRQMPPSRSSREGRASAHNATVSPSSSSSNAIGISASPNISTNTSAGNTGFMGITENGGGFTSFSREELRRMRQLIAALPEDVARQISTLSSTVPRKPSGAPANTTTTAAAAAATTTGAMGTAGSRFGTVTGARTNAMGGFKRGRSLFGAFEEDSTNFSGPMPRRERTEKQSSSLQISSSSPPPEANSTDNRHGAQGALSVSHDPADRHTRGDRNTVPSTPAVAVAAAASPASNLEELTCGPARKERHGDGVVLLPPPFTRPARSSVLRLLRTTVFENTDRFLLSPVYRFMDVLGAVNVSSKSVRTNFPTPMALMQAPEEGFSPTRRVLLVALDSTSPEYDHTSGWMQPFKLDDQVYRMTLRVNGQWVSVPTNWNIPATKERTAVKTAPVIDITSIVMSKASSRQRSRSGSRSSTEGSSADGSSSDNEESSRNHHNRHSHFRSYRYDDTLPEEETALEEHNDDIFSLEVFLSTPPENSDILLWEGMIACLFVDAVPLSDISHRILEYYRPMPPHTPAAAQDRSPSTTRTRPRVRGGATPSAPTTSTSRRQAEKARTIATTSATDEDETINVVTGSIAIRCPLTTFPLVDPVRSVHCEHLQCMELSAVLQQCIRSNVWNCPLCSQPMKPTDICVHFRLRQWLQEQSQHMLSKIDYVIDDGTSTLTPHFIASRPPVESIDILD